MEIKDIEVFKIGQHEYLLPASNEEVMLIVKTAAQSNQKIVMRGSAHSMPLVETTEAQSNTILVMLAKMNKITEFDKDTGIVTVQAGCHLGLDPNDPTKISTIENSLVYQIDPFDIKKGKRTVSPGWALPDLGGISHQMIGGFMATGSSGGSTHAGFEQAIISIDIIHFDGNDAVLKTFSRPAVMNENDPFFGIGFANLGLMGIIVSVTFQCIPSYNIVGNEAVTHTADCEVDVFGSGTNGKKSLADFFQSDNLFSRLLWWPQEGIDKMVLWQAKAVDPNPDWQKYTSKPYEEVPYIFGDPTPANRLVGWLFATIDNWPLWIEKLFGVGEKTRESIENFANKLNTKIVKIILDIFEPTGKKPQQFHDVWWNGLPMDNGISDIYNPVKFTELWIPIEKTEEVMNTLKSFYAESNVHVGNFSSEIYAAGKNDFWLSPSCIGNVIRIDLFWLGRDHDGTPEAYYAPFWEKLAQFNYRPHWAKYLPEGDSNQGHQYLSKLYPHWQDWMNLRTQMDPNNIFLSDYWKKHLGINI